MHKKKYILLSLVGLVILCIVLIAIVVTVLDDDDYKKLVILVVERYTGYKTAIDGAFELDLSTEPSLTASEIRFEAPPGGSQPPFTHIGRLKIKLSARQLLTGMIVIKELEVDDVAISLTIGKGRQVQTTAQQKEGTLQDIAVPILKNVTLRNISVDLSDMNKRRLVQAQLRHFKINDDPDTGFQYVKGEGAVNKHDFKIKGRIGSLTDILDNTKPYPFALNLKSEGIDFKVSGEVDDPIRGQGLDLHVAGEAAELSNLLKLFQMEFPGLGHLKFESDITGNAETPRASNIVAVISGGSHVELSAKGSITDLTSGKGTDIEIFGSITNNDVIKMLLPDILSDFNRLELEGNLRDRQGDYVLEEITASGSNDQGLALITKGLLNFGKPAKNPLIKAVDLKLQLSSQTTQAAKRFLIDLLPEMGQVSGNARLSGPVDKLSLEDIAVSTVESGPLQMKAQGRIGWIPIEDGVPISDLELVLSVQAEQMRALGSAFDIPLPELGPVSLYSRILYTDDQLQFNEVDVHTSTGQGLIIELSGKVDMSLKKTQKPQGDVDLHLVIAAPNMEAAAPLLGTRILSGMGPVQGKAQITGTPEVISLENIAVTVGQPTSAHIKLQGRAGKIPLGSDLPISDVEVLGSIHAQETSAFAALAGISIPDLGPLKGTWRFVDRKGGFGVDDMEIHIGNKEAFLLKAAGKIDSVMRRGKVSINGIDVDLIAAASDTAVVPILKDLSLPDLGSVRMKAHMSGGEDSLDIKEFTLSTGPKEKASFFMQGEILRIESPKKISLKATFETATQPWVKKLMQRSVPQNYQLMGTLKLAGPTDYFRIQELKLATKNPERLSLQANGIVKNMEGLFETDIQIAASSKDPSVIGSILGISLPSFSPLAVKGRFKGDGRKADFEGETHFGKTHFKTVINHSTSNHNPKIAIKISSPSVYLSDLGVYPRYAAEKTERKKTSRKTTDRLFSEEPLTFDALKALNLSLSIDVEKLIAKDSVINNLDFDLSLDNGLLRISPARLSYAQGEISFESSLDIAGEKPEVMLKATAEDVDMDVLLAHINRPIILGGHLNMTVDLHGTGSSLHEIASSLNGEFSYAIENGRIKRDVEMLTSDAVDLVAALPKIKTYQDLNCLVLRFIFADGIGKSEIMFLDTPNVRSRGVGTIDLTSETVDFVVQPKPKKGLPGISSTVRIYGPLTNPTVRKIPFKEAARLYGEIFMPYVFLPARALGYLWYLMKNDKDEQSPCLEMQPMNE